MNLKDGFSTTSKHFDLPTNGTITIGFKTNSEWVGFYYEKYGSKVFASIKIESPMFQHLIDHVSRWKPKGIRRVSDDLLVTEFEVYLSFPKFVELLEMWKAEEENQNSTPLPSSEESAEAEG